MRQNRYLELSGNARMNGDFLLKPGGGAVLVVATGMSVG